MGWGRGWFSSSHPLLFSSGFLHGSGPALSTLGAQMPLQTVVSALWPGKAPRVPHLQPGDGQASAVAPRSDLNAVTLEEVDKILYENKNPQKYPSPCDCSSRCPLFKALLALICRSCWAQPRSACMEWGRKDHLPMPRISPLPPAFDGIFLSASKGLSSDSTARPEPVPMMYVVMPPVATSSLAPSKSWSSFTMRSLGTLLPSSASFNPQTSQQVKGTWQLWGQGARRVRKTLLSGPRIFVPLALLRYLPLPHPQSSLIPIIWFV